MSDTEGSVEAPGASGEVAIEIGAVPSAIAAADGAADATAAAADKPAAPAPTRRGVSFSCVSETKAAPDADERPYLPGQVLLEWRNVGLRVKLKEKNNEERVILSGITGSIAPGQLLAVMGPSGAGKSTLLNILAQRIPVHEGTVLVNGEKPGDAFKRVTGYVTQDTVYLQSLTVREVLRYGAELSLPSSMTKSQKFAKVEEILRMLDIQECADTRIGNASESGGISGGERRRLAVGMELLFDPQLLFLDEPTSGLDSASAIRVINILRKLASTEGVTVICTIHQPRASILPMFDKLLLLADGGTVYFGDTWSPGKEDGMLEYLRSAGFPCPPFENPADHIIDLVDPLFDVPELRSVRSGSVSGGVGPDGMPTAIEDIGDRSKVVSMLKDKYKASPEARTAAAPIVRRPPRIVIKRGGGAAGTPTGWWNQFSVVFRRSFFYKLREPTAVMTQAANSIFLSVLIGFIYFQMDLSQAAAADRVAAISFVIMCQAFLGIDAILLFPIERVVYLRDQASGLYHTSSYFFARSAAETPAHLLFGALVGVITYLMMGMQGDFDKFCIYVLTITAVTFAGVSFLMLVGAVSKDMAQGNLIGTICLILLTLFNGFFVNRNNIPAPLQWISDISFLGYGVEAAVVSELRGLTFTCTAEEAAVGCIPSGDLYLNRLGMQDASIFWLIFWIFFQSFVFRVAAFFALHFMYTGQPMGQRCRSLR